MMDVAVILVGMDGWEEFTKPAVLSIRKYEPSARVVVMDCGAHPYPPLDGILTRRLDASPSYAFAINRGIAAAGKADWYLILNNDIRVDGPLAPAIEQLSPHAIYGRQIITEQGHTWLGLWLALIPFWVWHTVGEFDEGFKLCGFEDADYCVRAKALGFDTRPVELPVTHFWGKTRWGLPHYPAVRKANMNYFEQKHGYRLGENVRVVHD